MKLKDLSSFDVDILQELEMGIVKGGWRRETTSERDEKSHSVFYNETPALLLKHF